MNWGKAIKAIPALLQVFQKGKEVANPGAWKNVQVVAGLLTAVLSVFAAFGYDFGISQSDILLISAGIGGLGSAIITVITSQKVGFRSSAPAAELPPINLVAHSEPDSMQPIPLPPNSPIQSAPADSNADDNERRADCNQDRR